MKRRTVLLGLGASAAAGGAVFGTGAFDSATANRDATVAVAGDANAYLSLDATDDQYADTIEVDGNKILTLDFTENGKGDGLGKNSTYEFDNLFDITNQGTDPIELVYVIDPGTDGNGHGGIEEFTLYEGDDPGTKLSRGPDSKSGKTLEVGEPVSVGVEIKTTKETVNGSNNELTVRLRTIDTDLQGGEDGKVKRTYNVGDGNGNPTIQSGIAAAQNDAAEVDIATIKVAPGTYAEQVTVPETSFDELRLEGPNAGTDAVGARPTPSVNPSGDAPIEMNGGRGDEAFIVPPSPDPARDALVRVEGSDVTIDGFTLTGSDIFGRALEGINDDSVIQDISPDALGADFGIQIEGDSSSSAPSGVTVKNNVIRAFGSYGVFGRGGVSAKVANNLITDLPGVFGRIEEGDDTPSPSLRTGVRFAQRSTATVSNNTMTRVFIGVEGDKSDLTSTDNFIESERVGIRTFRGPASADIDNNYLDTFRPESFQNAGIWIQSVGGEVTADDNIIANSFSGVEIFSTDDVNVDIDNTQIDRCLRGIYAYNYADVTRSPSQQPQTSNNPATTTATVAGDDTEIRNCLVGIFAEDRRPDASNTSVTLTVNSAEVDEPQDGPEGINRYGRVAVDNNVEDAVESGDDATIENNAELSVQSRPGPGES